jgi:putative DNA primase/helicase
MIIPLREIASRLGGLRNGAGFLCRCPVPGHGAGRGDRSPSLSIADGGAGLLLQCFAGCDPRDVLAVLRRRGLVDGRERSEVPVKARKPPALRELQPTELDTWRAKYIAQTVSEMVPILGTPGETYLRDVRRIDTGAIMDVLERIDAIGWHPACLFREEDHPLNGKRLGCIVAIMTDAATGKPTGGISRTYIHEGLKVTKAKGFGPAGLVRLTPDEDVLSGLFLTEGLESALAGMSIGLRPLWSVGSTAIMAKFPVLGGIESLAVIADHDANGAGEKAARAVEARWLQAGREVRALMPNEPGDLNDVLRRAF